MEEIKDLSINASELLPCVLIKKKITENGQNFKVRQ